ncbi:MAG: glycosyltransferase family 4 protein [Sphingobacteriales bacterium]|nr:glycosyltransferase family 4 protein [Sphingobacteriales bacterium]
MNKILLSAFACDPLKGSESGNGWNWAIGLAQKQFEVHCLTRQINRQNIEKHSIPDNLYFHYITLPLGLEFLYSYSQATMYIYYLIWQWLGYVKSKKLHKKKNFHIAHHVTWGSLQMGSFLYMLGIPFIFGPAGGGQSAPVAFQRYFKKQWSSEVKREFIAKLLLKFNPGFNQMIRKAKMVLVSNSETFKLATKVGAKCSLTFDAAVAESFFPQTFTPKSPKPGNLKLLWVGRFMPRKGVLLLIEVMKELQAYPNITLTLVGDGEMANEIQKLILDEKISDRIFMIGRVPFDQVKDFYLSHDVFFFASLRDSCPAQLIEAMAYGLPIVTLNLHGQSLIVNQETGIRCSCETPEIAISELKEAVIQLFNNPETVRTMSQAAYKFAKKQTWTEKIETIIAKYYID